MAQKSAAPKLTKIEDAMRPAVSPTAISSGGSVSGIVRRVTTNGCGKRRRHRSHVSARRSPVAWLLTNVTR